MVVSWAFSITLVGRCGYRKGTGQVLLAFPMVLFCFFFLLFIFVQRLRISTLYVRGPVSHGWGPFMMKAALTTLEQGPLVADHGP